MFHFITMEAIRAIERETEGVECMDARAEGVAVPQAEGVAVPQATLPVVLLSLCAPEELGLSLCPPERSAFVSAALRKLTLDVLNGDDLRRYETQNNYFTNIKSVEICCNKLATCLRDGEKKEFYDAASQACYPVRDAFVHFCLSAQPALIPKLFKPNELKNDSLRTYVLNNFTLEARSQWENLAKKAMYPRPPRKRDREVYLVMQRVRCGKVNFKALEKHAAETHYLKNYMTEKPQRGSLSFHDLLTSGQWTLFWYYVNQACSEAQNVFVHFLLDAQKELNDLIVAKETLKETHPSINSLREYLNDRSSLDVTGAQSFTSPLYYIIMYMDDIILGKADSCLALLYMEIHSGRVKLYLFADVLKKVKKQNRKNLLEKALAKYVDRHYKMAEEAALKFIIRDVLPLVHTELQSEFTLRHTVLIMSNLVCWSGPQGNTEVYLPQKSENPRYRERLDQLAHSLKNYFATDTGHLTSRYKFSC